MSGRCRRAASTRARTLWPAALRELYEETNIRSVEKLGEIDEWLTYDIPREIVGQAWKGKYRGQKQKWFALRFTGDEREIDIAHPAGGHEPEFVEWRWEPMQNLPDADRAVQAAGLRAGGEGIREVCEISKPVGWTFSEKRAFCLCA